MLPFLTPRRDSLSNFFAAIMGVPNATGIWLWADMYNNDPPQDKNGAGKALPLAAEAL